MRGFLFIGHDDLMLQVQVEDEEGSHGNLLSMGHMPSLPSDSYAQPLRSSPYPPFGHDTYCGYSYSGDLPGRGQRKARDTFYCAVTTNRLL